jgi:UDP-2,3-diacylglucosamine pyrophosphatase LpxH
MNCQTPIAHRPAVPAYPAPAHPAYAALFISDLHLGARACRDMALLGFLQAHEARRIYLVGDVFDTWNGLGGRWTDNQHAVIQLLLARAQAGVEIIYTPGNHDAFFRQYIGAVHGNISILDHAFHVAADGRRYLVIHGDSVDILSGRYPILSRLAAKSEHVFRGVAAVAQRLLRQFDLPIAARVDGLVARINTVIRAQDDFQQRLAGLARDHGADGIICGHFHQPALHDDYGVTYANCGDWVENASALAETHAGNLIALDWSPARVGALLRTGKADLVQEV